MLYKGAIVRHPDYGIGVYVDRAKENPNNVLVRYAQATRALAPEALEILPISDTTLNLTQRNILATLVRWAFPIRKGGMQPESVNNVREVAKLVAKGYLRRVPVLDDEDGCMLTVAGCRAIGCPVPPFLLEEAKDTQIRRTGDSLASPRYDEAALREAAKEMIRPYILRGDSLESLMNGQMGQGSPGNPSTCVQIGGWLFYAQPRQRIPRGKIGVEFEYKSGVVYHKCFDLKALAQEIRAEAAAPAGGALRQLSLF